MSEPESREAMDPPLPPQTRISAALTDLPLTRESVLKAHELIKPHIHRTPVLTSKTLNRIATRGESSESDTEGLGVKFNLFFKAECYQRVGAFKFRGARHALGRLVARFGEEEVRRRGVVTYSSGNHAQALALAASELSIPCHVVMPTTSTPSKIAATGGYGAKILLSGTTSQEREEAAAEVQTVTGAILVPPHDHPDIMCGQGTMAIELQQQATEILIRTQDSQKKALDAIITPCGGGGMLSGVAIACEGTGIRVFGAEPEEGGADDCMRGLQEGKRIETVNTSTIADGLRAPVGKWPWKIISNKEMVEGVYSVSEEQIRKAMRLVIERMKVVVEPSSAVPVAVVLYNKEFREAVERMWPEGVNLGIVLSGGNTTVEKIAELFARG